MSDNRLGNIGSILNGGNPRPRLIDPDAEAPAGPEAAPTSTAQPATRPPTRSETTKPAPQTAMGETRPSRRPARPRAAGPRRVALRLEQQLRDQLVDRSSRERPLAAVVLGMIAEAHERNELTQHVQAEQARQGSGGGLFAGTATRIAGRATALVELRMSTDDFEVLDTLARKAGAKDRSQFITAVVRARLDP